MPRRKSTGRSTPTEIGLEWDRKLLTFDDRSRRDVAHPLDVRGDRARSPRGGRRPRSCGRGRPPWEEWASLLSTWIRPASASERMPAAMRSRRKKSAVAWTSAPAAISAAIRSYMSAERWRSGWAIRARWPRSARCSTRRIRLSLSGPGAGSSRTQLPSPSVTRLSSSSLRSSTAVSATSPPCSTATGTPSSRRALVDLLDPIGELLDPHVVVVADVRRRADRLDAVVGRLAAPCRGCRGGRARRRRAPGRMWQCRSIKTRAARLAGPPRAAQVQTLFQARAREGMGLR